MSKPSQRFARFAKNAVDLRVVGDVERQREVAAELGRHFVDAAAQLVGLVAQRELGAFAAHRLRDSPSDRAVAREADHDGAFAREESHQTRSGGISRFAR